jgi:peroxiredoxin
MLIHYMMLGLVLAWVFIVAGGWLGWQLLRQNGRLLLRLDEVEQRLNGLEFGENDEPAGLAVAISSTDAAETDGRANRFGNRSLERSKLKRDGLKAGTPAPDFNLPRLDGRGELQLSGLRGKRVLLVFSSPGCGPCNTLAPELEKFHRDNPELVLVMISKGEPSENRAKAKEHGLTFTVVLQQQWEISRRYAMFATPIAYLIDERGLISHDVAVGIDAITVLLATVSNSVDEQVAVS